MNIKQILAQLEEKVREFLNKFFNKNETDNPNIIQRDQTQRLGIIIIIIFFIIYIISRIIDNASKPSGLKNIEKDTKKPEKIEIQSAGSSLKPQDLWTNKLEDDIELEKKQREEKEKELLSLLQQHSDKIKKEKDEEIRKLQEQLNLVTSDIDQIKKKPDLEESSKLKKKIQLSMVEPDINKKRSKDLQHYIPATTFISGKLLGGISVSTSVASTEEPVPVIIRLTDFASLPQQVKLNYRDCRILGSCYGDISSERAITRVEKLVCIDVRSNRAVETLISGFIYGPDGLNGIKGKVVSMDSKHLKNAALGGFLSGISKGLKNESQTNFSIFGSSSKNKGWQDKFEDAGSSGLGSAADKLAEYHIKRADMISPVVQIPAGVKVDVVLSKGVFIGSDDVKEKIAEERVNTQNKINNY